MTYRHGIRENLDQFLQQLLQVFFVGLTIGMQRNVVPVLAESEFGVAAGSYTLLMAFVVSFGFVKGAMNFVSGRLSEKTGRRPVLIWGWLVALPIPFIFLYALGMLVGPPAAGLAMDVWDPHGLAFALAALFGAYVVVGVVAWLREPRSRETRRVEE